ncbi:odorant receptor 9a [Monomorium pharaonis]|uniref:odorant receptor 9a n=1 Tax=Monomorium pharaonis TaxID=307658 RepID=UPI00063FB579|nr:odorant receptor 9a [Monomorium pharaonis]
MSFYNNHYYHFNKISLCIIGQWPFQSRLKNNVMFALTLIFTCSLIGLEFWGFVTGATDLEIIMDNLSPMFLDLVTVVKLIMFSFYKYEVKQLLIQIEEVWKLLGEGPENEILQRHGEQSKIYTSRYAIGLYLSGIFYLTPPVITSGINMFLSTNETQPPRFLYRLEHVLDVDKYYNLLMVHTFISIFGIVAIATAVDGMFIFCIEHICALFNCAKYNMARIQSSELILLNPSIADDEAYHNIIRCIQLHTRILKFFDLLSSVYSTIFMTVVGSVIICLSLGAAEFVMVDTNFIESVRILAANSAESIHIYVMSYICQRLINYSSEFQDVIYNCNWYKISLRSRQLLRFTLMRAFKPCQIRAGNVFVVSMETFGSLLKMTVSYFTMLTSLQ